jgi:hypothetical protein
MNSEQQSERTPDSRKPRRVPRKGAFFVFLRVGGILLAILGLPLLCIGGVGFIAMLVQLGPTLMETFSGLGEQMSGFVFLASLGYLSIFPVVGLVGAVMLGIGLLLIFAATERAVPAANPASGQADTV